MRIHLIGLLGTLVTVGAAVGCGDDTEPPTSTSTSTTTTTTTTSGGGEGGGATTTTTTTTTTTSGGGEGGGGGNANPPPPVLGAMIERMGRPAINTAANNTFNADMAAKDAAKDAYNQSPSANWAGFAPEVAKNLAILDSLDATCGNQLLAGPMAVAGRYDTLASVLADDRLWVNSNGASCGAYLAVEANATGILPNMDCGGRTLKYDVIETSYSVLAAGALTGVDDTITADPVKTGGTAFPYLAAP